jgi:hypothetical protein
LLYFHRVLSFTQSENRTNVKIELTETSSAKTQIGAVVAALEERLPQGWQIDVAMEPRTDQGRPDAIVTVRSPDGASTDVVVEYKTRIDPADVGAALAQLERWPQAQPMVIAPFLSTRTRRLLSERGASWADATGNLRVALARPPVFVELAGATTNPFGRRDSPLKSLKGAGAAGVVRALCDYRPPFTVSQLARGAGLPVASVFRVVDLLLKESLVEKASKRGAIVSVDWAGLLARWCEDYSLLGSNRALSVLEPRGTDALLQKLREANRDYALSASAVALRVAPVAPSRLIVVYSEAPEALAADLALAPADAGANAFVVEPFSPALMARTEMRDGLRCAALSQVAADLLTSPGRGPAEGEALMSWMRENEDQWRLMLST